LGRVLGYSSDTSSWDSLLQSSLSGKCQTGELDFIDANGKSVTCNIKVVPVVDVAGFKISHLLIFCETCAKSFVPSQASFQGSTISLDSVSSHTSIASTASEEGPRLT
jgi:hypothetical protein